MRDVRGRRDNSTSELSVLLELAEGRAKRRDDLRLAVGPANSRRVTDALPQRQRQVGLHWEVAVHRSGRHAGAGGHSLVRKRSGRLVADHAEGGVEDHLPSRGALSFCWGKHECGGHDSRLTCRQYTVKANRWGLQPDPSGFAKSGPVRRWSAPASGARTLLA